eukprot:60754-Chlamydomonas_euryale.AAC.2
MRLSAAVAAYRERRVAAPPKHVFTMSQDMAFVHQRRMELDVYLQLCPGGCAPESSLPDLLSTLPCEDVLPDLCPTLLL